MSTPGSGRSASACRHKKIALRTCLLGAKAGALLLANRLQVSEPPLKRFSAHVFTVHEDLHDFGNEVVGTVQRPCHFGGVALGLKQVSNSVVPLHRSDEMQVHDHFRWWLKLEHFQTAFTDFVIATPPVLGALTT